jgi:hypothetical protein
MEGVNVAAVPFSKTRLDALLETAFPRPIGTSLEPGDDRAQTLFLGASGGFVVATTRFAVFESVFARAGDTQGTASESIAARSPPSADAILHLAIDVPRWLNTSRLAAPRRGAAESSRFLSWEGLVQHLGIVNLRTLSLTLRGQPGGWFTDLRLAIPEASRRGLFKVMGWRAADAAPPAVIPETVMRFSRFRVDGGQAWSRLLRAVREADASLAGIVQLFAGYAGKTEDADFDFEKSIIGLLGDDWMSVTLPGSAPGAPDTLYLVGSEKADELAAGFKLVMAPTYLATFLPPSAPSPVREERDAAGHPVVSVSMPALPWPAAPGSTGAVHFASRHGYVALSTSLRAVEEFVTSEEAAPLFSTPRYQTAVAALGGAQSGYLAYRNELAIASRMFRDASRAPDFLEGTFRWAVFSETATRLVSALGGWMEFEKLPPFEAVARHFGIAVRKGEITSEGFTITTFRPAAPRD